MDKKIPYVSINDRDYVPREEYKDIEKRKWGNVHALIGWANSVIALGIPSVYLGYASGSEQNFVEILKNSKLENLVLWGGLFLANFVGAYYNFSKAYQLKKDLKD